MPLAPSLTWRRLQSVLLVVAVVLLLLKRAVPRECIRPALPLLAAVALTLKDGETVLDVLWAAASAACMPVQVVNAARRRPRGRASVDTHRPVMRTATAWCGGSRVGTKAEVCKIRKPTRNACILPECQRATQRCCFCFLQNGRTERNDVWPFILQYLAPGFAPPATARVRTRVAYILQYTRTSRVLQY